MPITVERYWDKETLEIKLGLPQGDSFIIASREADGFYNIEGILPWFTERDYFGPDAISRDEKISQQKVLSIYESPVYELIAIIRKALPAFEQLRRDASLDA